MQHHGVKGMHWGVRRYQNRDGTRTAAGKKRYNTDKGSSKNTNKKKVSTRKGGFGSVIGKKLSDRKKEALKAKQAKETLKEKQNNEAYEAEKQKALKSGSASDVLKFKGNLTPQEMQASLSRIQWERSMKGIADKDIAESREVTNKYVNTLNKVTDVISTTSKAYNTVANVYNAFSGLDAPMLPKIEVDNLRGNRAQRRAEADKHKKD